MKRQLSSASVWLLRAFGIPVLEESISFFLLTFMEIQLIYNVAMVPDVRQSDSVIRYAHSHSFSAYSLFE